MPPTHPTSSVITEQITRALGEAVIRVWSNLPQEVQNHLFQEAVTSQGESIRSQRAVFLHDTQSRTGNPRQAPEPDSLRGSGINAARAASPACDYGSGIVPLSSQS